MNIHVYHTRTRNESHRQYYNTSIMGNSYLIQSPKFWDHIPLNMKEVKNIKSFSKKLKKLIHEYYYSVIL